MTFMPRVNYEMTEEDLAALMDSCKPTPVMYLTGGQPMFDSPQENANRAWKRLGEKMGFDHMTVAPIPGQGTHFFTAVPKETEAQMMERAARELDLAKSEKIARLKQEIAQRQEELDRLIGVGVLP